MKLSTFLIGALALNAAAAGAELPKTHHLLTHGNEPVRIVCFGDSITGVYYHTGGRRAWNDMLGIALQRMFPKARLQMTNAGVSGNTTGAALARMERDVLAHRPHLVVVMFGMNDMAFDAKGMNDAQIAERQTRFGGNLREIIRRCRAAGAEVLLCTPNSIYPDAGPRRPQERLAKYAEEVRAVAAGAGVPVADCHRAYELLRRSDPRAWMLLMSETIHPNMNGHKLFAEEMARVIGGKRISLGDVMPVQPCLTRTLDLLRHGKPIKLVAMEPYDVLVPQVVNKLKPGCEVRTTCWPAAGKSLAELENWGKGLRGQKPDFVVIAVPAGATAPANMEAFIRSYSWVVNWALPFGRAEWDVVAVLPTVQQRDLSAGQGDRFVKTARDIILGHDVACIERSGGDTASTEEVVQRWFAAQERH